METSNAKRKAIEELKGEIELKNDTVKAAQIMFAKQLKDGMGQDMKNVLQNEQESKKKTFWQKLKENFKKINA